MKQLLFGLISVIVLAIQSQQIAAAIIDDLWTVGLEVSRDSYHNWASSINNNRSFLIVYPRNSREVVRVVTGAYTSGRNVRVQGHRHSYPPITVSEFDDPSKVIILDMTRHMTRQRMGSVPGISSQLTTVVAEAGASMEDFFRFAEVNGYGIEMAPIVGGDATVGGVLAIGGHGAGIPALNERLTGPGFTFGSVSNSIAELKAVVWDSLLRQYVLKTFTRSNPDIAAFLVHIGRAVITEVTLLVGRNYNMRCISRVDVPASELFAHPDNATGLRTYAKYSDQYGRVDVIWFPFTERPWLKVWEVTNVQPSNSRLVTQPYNYQFSYTFDNPQTPGTVFGPQTYDRLIAGLTEDRVWDIWGPSKNTILYYNRTSTPLVYSGFVVVTNRANAQLVLHEIAQFYTRLSEKYGAQGIYPIDQYIKLRASGLDDPSELGISGAVASDISPTSPMRSRPDFDVGVWMNTLYTTRRPYSDQFMREFELWAYQRFDGSDALARPEWSKAWGHTKDEPFADPKFLHDVIPRVFGIDEWNHAIHVLDKYDPHHVISNKFLRDLMVPYKSKARKNVGMSMNGFVGPRYIDDPGFGWSNREYLESIVNDDIYG